MLKRVASVLTAEVRHTDLVARFGGEEFVLVLVETGAEAAAAVCEKVRAAIAAHDWSGIAPGSRSRVSIGCVRRHHLAGPEAMLAWRMPRSTARRRRDGTARPAAGRPAEAASIRGAETAAARYIFRTSPTITPKISSAPSGRIGA